jgi:hypothetical protein
MTEAELLEHYWNAQGMAVNAFVAYISILSGYLVVAFIIGVKLTRAQTIFMSIGFMVFQVFCIWGTFTYWNMGYIAAATLKSALPEILPIELNPAYLAGILQFGGVVGALKFMWDIRHPKAE